jgi:FkbM family methyltransferase
LYLRLFFPRHAARKKRELDVYRSLITREGAIFDIGANIGAKASLFTQVAGTVVCVEPDAAAVESLRRRFQSNRGVHIVHAGVRASAGAEKMYQLDPASPYNTFSRKWMNLLTDRTAPRFANPPAVHAVVEVPTTTLDRLIDRFGRPAYIKIDTEGTELDVIRGLSTPVSLLSFEVILPEFVDETLEILAILHARDPRAVFNYCLDLDTPDLQSARWLPYEEMCEFVRSGKGLLMEIYCRGSDQ